mgnify:CR=1 FL=1
MSENLSQGLVLVKDLIPTIEGYDVRFVVVPLGDIYVKVKNLENGKEGGRVIYFQDFRSCANGNELRHLLEIEALRAFERVERDK